MEEKNTPIELVHFFTDISSGGNSQVITKYRQYIYEYVNRENDMYIFDVDKLRKDGWQIPESIKEMKGKVETLEWAAFMCSRLGIDAFHHIVSSFIQIEEDKNKEKEED